MSIAALNEVSIEARRLAIAGASLAPGDFRLQKLIEPLEKSGEKAPVFAKVAGAVKAVVESSEHTAATALLDLSTLVNAIRYTQGKTTVDGDCKVIETSPVQGTTTKTSYRVIAPLIEALTTTGQGRFDIVEDAWKRGAFADVRLIRPAILALGDKYGELATLVSEKVVPSFGPGIIPLLLDGLDPKGGIVHARRLRAVSKIDPDKAREVARNLIDDATKDMKIAAVKALRGSAEDIDILIEAATAKAKDVRRAVFVALAGVPGEAVKVLFRKAIHSRDLELVSETIGDALPDDLVGPLVEVGDSLLAEVTKNKSPGEKAMVKIVHVLQALSGNLNADSEAFTLRVFGEREHFGNLRKVEMRGYGERLNSEVSEILGTFGSEGAARKLIDARNSLSSTQIAGAMLAAARYDPPKKVHKDFSPFLLKPSNECEIIKYMVRWDLFYGVAEEKTHRVIKEIKKVEWAEAWLDTAIKGNHVELVCHLAKPSEKKADTYLRKQLNYDLEKKVVIEKDDSISLTVLATLIDLGSKDATKLVCQAVASVLTRKDYYWYDGYYSLIQDLPVESVGAVEKFVKALPEKDIDQLLPHLAELKSKAARAK